MVSPLLANVYLHELDKYMQRYTALTTNEKRKRRRQGLANYVYIRYADDFVVLCNGTKEQAEALREELYQVLKATLRLELSKEKTNITHLNDGFNFLGFRMQRGPGAQGMRTTVFIPQEAIAKVRAKLGRALAPSMGQDAVNAKILAMNRLMRGWCRYYQYTGKASTQFRNLGHQLFWSMARWLGRKFSLSMPVVMQRFRRGHTFATTEQRLIMPTDFPRLPYRQRFLKPNPYLMQTRTLEREALPHETYWTGYEARPGMADLRPLVLARDEHRCQRCGAAVTAPTAEVDHIRPVRRFKRPIDANTFDNLWTLCIPCHRSKTESDRQVESRVR